MPWTVFILPTAPFAFFAPPPPTPPPHHYMRGYTRTKGATYHTTHDTSFSRAGSLHLFDGNFPLTRSLLTSPHSLHSQGFRDCSPIDTRCARGAMESWAKCLGATMTDVLAEMARFQKGQGNFVIEYMMPTQ